MHAFMYACMHVCKHGEGLITIGIKICEELHQACIQHTCVCVRARMRTCAHAYVREYT